MMGIDKRLADLNRKLDRIELAYLYKKLEVIDQDVGRLETAVKPKYPRPPESVAERFVRTVLSQYLPLLKSLCADMERKINVPHLDKEDLMQEALEYMLRWCLPKVIEMSTDDEVWLPYIRRSMNNCYVNLIHKHMSSKRNATTVELDDYLAKNYKDNNADVEHEFEYRDLITRVVASLPKMERTIFKDILKPPVSLRVFLAIRKIECKKNGTPPLSARKYLAEFYDLPITTVNSVFSRFKKQILVLSQA
jgi:DNA-directed RNA polymerase specialized sigma24 family protein